MARKDNSPVSIRIRLRYPDIESFVEKYAANVSQGGMFIQSRAPQPVGRLLRFEVLLADGAAGTLLQSMDLPPGTAPEAWVLERSEKIQALHQGYVGF